MPQSIYDNGGMIGVTLDFGDTDKYVIGTTTERATPVFVGAATDAEPGGTATYTFSLTSLTGGIASAPQEGDVVIIVSGAGSTSDVSMSMITAGYTELFEAYESDTVDTNLAVYYKVMGATPDTDVTINESGNAAFASAAIAHVWRNIDTSNPIDAYTTQFTGVNSAHANPPAVTTITENAVVLAIGASGNTGGSGTFIQGGDLENFFTRGSNDTYDITLGVGSIATTSPTSVNPAAFTTTFDNDTTFSWMSASVALKPKLVDVPILGNQKNSGIWSLNSVLEYKDIFGKFNESASLGTPTETITTVPSEFPTLNDGLQSYTYAIDLPSFSSSNTGILFELGGSTVGSSFQVSGGNLIVQTTGGADTSASMSAFNGETGTLYVSVSYGNVLDAYWIKNNGNPNSGAAPIRVLQITGFASDYVGTNASGIGAVGGGQLRGTDYGSYTGTITGWRSWANTYFDFSQIPGAT